MASTAEIAPAAEKGTCSDHDFRGTYAFHAAGENVADGSPITFAGSLHADGSGKIDAWKDWVAVPAPSPAPPNFKIVPPLRDIYQLAGRDIRYGVAPDCLLTIETEVPGPVPGTRIPIVMVGGLAAAGRKALLMNGAPGAPYSTTVKMERAEDPDHAELKEILRKIGLRLGISSPVLGF